MKTERNIALLMAAGTGSRITGKLPKQFMELGGKPMAAHSLDLFDKCKLIDEIILVVPEDHLALASRVLVDRFSFKKINKITTGGETRQESVMAGLSACPKGTDYVVIHDAARPLLTMGLLNESIEKAKQTKAAILAVPAKESVKLADGDIITSTLKRDSVWIAQTPQVFRFDEISSAHERANAAEYEATDDSELYERYCGKVSIVRGSHHNLKITTDTDFILAREILKDMK